jgi:phosphatidylglycerol---prolipoprotein diacylglyceryl transferase
MRGALDYYQHLPLHMDPIAFTVGSFSVGWYSLMYLLAMAVIYSLLLYRTKADIRAENLAEFYKKTSNNKSFSMAEFRNLLADLLLFSFMGALIGGRLGYVLFYNPLYYLRSPVEIISPYNFSTGEFVGIYGMSFHGGLIGVILIAMIFVGKNKLNFWKLADFVVPAIPAGYFFGRIGNFLNVELYGRVTDRWIGMYFPLSAGAGDFLRFPSQIIEAFLEGTLLFIILWMIRNKKILAGKFLSLYFIGYGTARFLGEFFREPDEQIGFIFSSITLGQIFSLGMIFCGLFLVRFQKRRKNSIIKSS